MEKWLQFAAVGSAMAIVIAIMLTARSDENTRVADNGGISVGWVQEQR